MYKETKEDLGNKLQSAALETKRHDENSLLFGLTMSTYVTLALPPCNLRIRIFISWRFL